MSEHRSTGTRGGASLEALVEPTSSKIRRLSQVFFKKSAAEAPLPEAGEAPAPEAPAPEVPDLQELIKENTFLRMEVAQFRKDQAQFGAEGPLPCGNGFVAESVPPLPPAALRASVSSPSLAGYLFVADAWQLLLSRLLSAPSVVLDIGCGCGTMARTLLYHPHVAGYIGIDTYGPSIEWCEQQVAPRGNGRFRFHFVDVRSQAYNPNGAVLGTEVVFPAEAGTVNVAFAASLFTHLLEPDSRHYLSEVARVLAPGGTLLATIHVNPSEGSDYSGDEVRIDVDPDRFVAMARDAGLTLEARIGAVCGQEAILFKKP